MKQMILALGAALLAGCASTSEQRERASTAYQQAEAQLQAETLTAGFADPRALAGPLKSDLHKYVLGPGKPVTEFAGGKAYYLVLELPAFTAPYHVEALPGIELIAGNALAQTQTLATLWPAMSLLDADFQLLQSLMPDYVFDQGRYASLAGNFGHISICDGKARYLAVHGLPPLYRRVSGDLSHSYSQYGTSTGMLTQVQMPIGELKIGIPEKPIGEGIFGSGSPLPPCQSPDRSVTQFLELLPAKQ